MAGISLSGSEFYPESPVANELRQIPLVELFPVGFRFQQVLAEFTFVVLEDEFEFVQITRPAEAVEEFRA